MAFDLDDVFAYTTFQVVRIRDRRLGIPYYVFMLAITGYIISSIITDQLYLKTEPPTAGSIRINLATPSALRNRTDISYCNGGSGTMSNVACGYLSAQIALVSLSSCLLINFFYTLALHSPKKELVS